MGDDLAALQARLDALKKESNSLDAELGAVTLGVATVRVPQEEAASRGYSSMLTMQGDVGGRKRAAVIRRAGTVGAACMAVLLVVTLASQDVAQPANGRAVLLGGDARASLSAVPQALEAVGHQLTEGERKLFAQDAKRLAADEAEHQNLERQRAAHLLKLITSTVDHNEKHQELEKHIASQVEEHRVELAMRRKVRRGMIRGTDGVVGHPQTVFKAEAGATQQLAPLSKPGDGLTGEIDQAFRRQLVDEHEKDAEQREQRESRFIQEREASQLARQSKERAVDDAREKYHHAREYVVMAKDALKDALAERDQKTEQVRAEGFISEKEALTQLAPIQNKVRQLLQEVVNAKSKWESAHKVLESAESIGTRPELYFPAVFSHPSGQQLALANKKASHLQQDGGFLPARDAAESASSAAAHAQKVSRQVSKTAQSSATQTNTLAAKPHSAQPYLLGGAHAMVQAARERLAIKAGLTDSIDTQKSITGPRTWHGADVMAPAPADMTNMMFKAPEQSLAGKPK